MSKTNNEWYNKGYNDGYADALNNLEINDILEHIPKLSEEERQKVLETINN